MDQTLHPIKYFAYVQQLHQQRLVDHHKIHMLHRMESGIWPILKLDMKLQLHQVNKIQSNLYYFLLNFNSNNLGWNVPGGLLSDHHGHHPHPRFWDHHQAFHPHHPHHPYQHESLISGLSSAAGHEFWSSAAVAAAAAASTTSAAISQNSGNGGGVSSGSNGPAPRQRYIFNYELHFFND